MPPAHDPPLVGRPSSVTLYATVTERVGGFQLYDQVQGYLVSSCKFAFSEIIPTAVSPWGLKA